MKQCGVGSFFLVVFFDPNPIYKFRKTSLGRQMTNINVYDSKRKLKAFKKVLHPGFCIVKPTELTLRLFDTSTKFHWPNEDDESHLEYLYRWQQYRVDSIYFNSKLNSDEDYQKNLKIKILDEDEFCLSKNYTSTNDNAYIVHYNESDRKVLHPKNKIGRMKENNHWFIK